MTGFIVKPFEVETRSYELQLIDQGSFLPVVTALYKTVKVIRNFCRVNFENLLHIVARELLICFDATSSQKNVVK